MASLEIKQTTTKKTKKNNPTDIPIIRKCVKVSHMTIVQAHEQNTTIVKGDEGAVGLTEGQAALRR